MASSTSAVGGLSFGNLTTTSGAPRFSGSSSGIDTDKLIDALVAARKVPADRLDKKITRNEAKAAAYKELGGLLQNVKTALAGLRNPPGVLGVKDNLFEKKDVFYSADTATSPASLLSVSAANQVPPGKFDVVVERLATARKLSDDPLASDARDLASAANAGAAFSSTFTLGLAGGPTATIAVDGTMSLQDVKGAINAATATTGVAASVVKIAGSDYRLVLTANDTGKEVSLAPAGGSTDALRLLGLSDDGGATVKHSLSAPQTARVQIDGVAVERPGNQISDAIDGVTLNLFKAEPGTKVSVEVDRSLGGVKDQLKALADAYNAFRDFVAKQSALSDTGEVADGAVLFGDPLLRGLTQDLGGMLSAPIPGLAAGATDSLAGIGFGLDGSNKLTLDEAKLDDKLLNDLDGVRGVLEFRFGASSPDLAVFSRTNDLADSRFSVSIVDTDGDGVPEGASADGVPLDIAGGQLTGRAGTPYAGLSMIWTGHGSASIDVTATQGAADKIFNLIDKVTDQLQGSLTKAADDLGRQNTDYRAEIDRVNERADRYRQQLIDKYGAMETALALSKSMLQQVQASIGAFSQGG